MDAEEIGRLLEAADLPSLLAALAQPPAIPGWHPQNCG